MGIRKTSARFIVFLALLGCVPPLRAAEDFSTWAHSAKLHINTTSSGADVRKSMSGVPLLVRITDARILSQSMSDGSDLRFASQTGSALDFQIERWAPSQGKAEVWVRLPQIDSSSDKQSLTVYWGKSGAPWLSDGSKVFRRSEGFYAVYHLGEGGTQSRSNSAGNWNHATPQNYDGDERVEGVIGMADSLDGASMGGDYLALGSGFDSLQSFSFNVWADCAKATFADRILQLGTDFTQDQFAFGRSYQGDSLSAIFFQGGMYPTTVGAGGALGTGKWDMYGVTVSGKNVSLYKNGAKIAGGTLPQEMRTVSHTVNTLGQNPQGFGGGGFGGYGGGFGGSNGSTFAGKIDEPEFSFIGHSADWMKLVYENQRPDSKLFTWEFPADIKLAITTQPEGLTVAEGRPFALAVTAQGSGAIAYQWLKDGAPVTGAVSAQFRIAAAGLADAGLYACRVTDGTDTLLSHAAAVLVPEDLSTWAYSRSILLDPKAAGLSLSADVAEIPILLRLGRGNFPFGQAAQGGRDLRFAASDGTPLAYAIERWASDTAEVWVRLPQVSASGKTAFTLYWGKSTARAGSSPASVFSINDNWRAYYAFSDSVSASGSAAAGDATLNGYDAAGTGVASADAAVGRGFGFAASLGSHVQAPAAATAGLRAFTILAWVRETTARSGGAMPIQDPQLFSTGFDSADLEQFGLASKNGTLEGWVAGSPITTYLSQTASTRLDDGGWHLVAVSVAGADFNVYADGKPAFNLAAPDTPLSGNGLGIGGARGFDGSWSAAFTGDLDAVQILGEAKSADWIGLAYAGQRPGANLVAFQAASDQAPPAPRIDPPGGTFDGAVAVTLSCSADSVRIFYTLDGTDPDTSVRGSTRLYASPFQLAEDAEVRALASRKGQAGPVAKAAFHVSALPAGGDTLAPGGSRAIDGLRHVSYPFQDASSSVLILPGQAWNPKPRGFDRVGPLFQLHPLDTAAAFPGLSISGDSLEGLSLFRRETNTAILWMPPKDGALWIPSAGTYFWARDTLPPRIRLASATPHGKDSVLVGIIVDDNVAAVQAKIRFGRAATDSLSWLNAPSGDTVTFVVPAPSDPAVPLEADFSATDHSLGSDLPAQGFLTLPRPLPSVSAPMALRAGLKWKMAGMPLAPGLALSLKELAARSGTGPLYAAVWRGRTPPDSGYRVLKGDDTLPGGKGFWIASAGDAPTLNFPPASAVGSDSNGWFPIRLDSGWNLITCPSLRPLPWPVSVRDGDAYLRSALKPLFAYADTGYSRPDSLQPWRAYYVHYDKDTVVHVGANAPRLAAPAAKTSAAASLRLDLSVGAGVGLTLGAARAARDGLGVEDEGRPPGFAPKGAAKSAAWLSREGRALAVDYVAWDPDRAMAWTLALRSQPAGGALTVPAAALPSGIEAWAVSPSRSLKWPLVPGSNIPVTGDDTLLVYAGTPVALAKVPELQRGRAAAGAFAVRLRFAAGGLELILDLPSDARVSARLIDARGVLLGGFSERPFSPGRHTLSWPALSRSAAILPQGAYWLDLQAQGPGWTRRQAYPAGILH